MRFDPMSEADLDRASLLEEGVYPFEVLAASEVLSKAGNEMIKIKINVAGPNGRQAHIYDYLMEKLAFKLRHFCEATGLLTKYECGALSEIDCEGKTGWVKIKIGPAISGYSAKNVVQDYIVKDTKTAEMFESDIPRKLKPDEFNAKHGLDAAQTFDDDITF